MTPPLVLLGFMGAGKTTVGEELSRLLGWEFWDTDREVERETGLKVEEIFAREGEESFRERESRALQRALSRGRRVVAAGGGILLREENRQLILSSSFPVYLQADEETLLRRLGEGEGRPLLQGEVKLRVRELLEKRAPLYASLPHQVDASRSPREVAEEVIRLLREKGVLPRQEVEVHLGRRGYSIYVGAGLLGEVGELLGSRLPPPRRLLLLTHPSLHALYGERVLASLEEAGYRVEVALVPAGEESKSLEQAFRLYDRCLEAGLDRSSALLALGGGVAGDLGGFVAATFMRGIAFVPLPTTLLSQVDASVGGKVGVNHPRVKNLVGAFHQPSLVISDVLTLGSLPEREYRQGLGEVVKHGCLDRAYWEVLQEEWEGILSRAADSLIRVVAGSCQVKARVVEEDEREESGRRMVLNLGHTLAHALEAATGYRSFFHGEAVAVGLCAAARLSARLGLLPPEEAEELESLLAGLGLPIRLPGVSLARLEEAMGGDKKVRLGRLNWVLLRGKGEVVIHKDVPPEAVREVLLSLGASEP